MNFDEVLTVWRTAHNAPSAAELDKLQVEFSRKLRNQYRGFAGMTIWAVLCLAYPFGKLIQLLFTKDLVDLRQEWAVMLLLCLPSLALIIFVRQFLRHRRAHLDYQRSIIATIRALRDETRLSRIRLKGVFALQLISVPVIFTAVLQLQVAGKMRSHEAASAQTLLIGLLAIAAFGTAYYYFRILLPRERHLQSILQSYE